MGSAVSLEYLQSLGPLSVSGMTVYNMQGATMSITPSNPAYVPFDSKTNDAKDIQWDSTNATDIIIRAKGVYYVEYGLGGTFAEGVLDLPYRIFDLYCNGITNPLLRDYVQISGLQSSPIGQSGICAVEANSILRIGIIGTQGNIRLHDDFAHGDCAKITVIRIG